MKFEHMVLWALYLVPCFVSYFMIERVTKLFGRPSNYMALGFACLIPVVNFGLAMIAVIDYLVCRSVFRKHVHYNETDK